MCNPAAIALMTAGLAANEYGNRRAAKASGNVIAQGAVQQRALQNDLNSEVLTNAKEAFDPSAVAARYEDAATNREQALGQALSRANAAPDTEAAGQVSEDFLRGKAQRTAKQVEDIAKLTRLMGRASAQGTVNLDNSLRRMESNDRLTGIGQQMRMGQELTQTRLGEAAHKGDNAKTIGQLLQLGGVVYGSGAGATAAPNSSLGAGQLAAKKPVFVRPAGPQIF